tara:strand:+ start:117 stop:656 length:540 start_codon:yes stop_codon:yes gene_type:complete
MATTYFCPQLERRVCSKEFEDAKKIYIKNVKIPKLSIDWKIQHIDSDLIDEVFYYAIKFGYKASKYEEGNTIPPRAIRKYRKEIAERIGDYIITCEEAETFSAEDYANSLGIKENSIGDYDKMIQEATDFILEKYRNKDEELLDKEIKFYGNSVMTKEFRTAQKDIKYNSSEEYLNGKK